MNPDPESLFQYLDQTRQLYGNHLLLEDRGLDDIETLHTDGFWFFIKENVVFKAPKKLN